MGKKGEGRKRGGGRKKLIDGQDETRTIFYGNFPISNFFGVFPFD